MAQPNGQNSELDPNKHPSGSRIEKIISNSQANSQPNSQATSNQKLEQEKGIYGETLRPSEREDKVLDDNHRRTPSTRET